MTAIGESQAADVAPLKPFLLVAPGVAFLGPGIGELALDHVISSSWLPSHSQRMSRQ
ncbi:hypothetical protein RGR602_PC01805 (plasmid) [Rhizobium gallicum bv. gallicum R602sp]|uniref:Uncharacterized protein n=1 Tax=Rhizobium gallicum bv. gallicum R602sp TaxID=1041138 RepID=A0A0B4XCT9_9HYPH|nr:hypothetical protein RGR602_PC01805 [Rhizobium gallicum bv. gallicum R602sp]